MRTKFLVNLVVMLAASCSHGHDSEELDELIVNCEQASGSQVAASDETYVKFVEAEAAGTVLVDPCRSPELLVPAAGTVLDRTTAPTFEFRPTRAVCPSMTATQTSSPSTRVADKSPVRAPRTSSRSAWRRLLRSLSAPSFEGIAYAHCPAVSGENYYFRLRAAGDMKPFYTALLSVTSFTPNANIWEKATAGRAGQTVTLTIERAVFVRGSLREGPFTQPEPYRFTIAP